MQYQSALKAKSDVIVSRNKPDFAAADEILVFTPKELLEYLQSM